MRLAVQESSVDYTVVVKSGGPKKLWYQVDATIDDHHIANLQGMCVGGDVENIGIGFFFSFPSFVQVPTSVGSVILRERSYSMPINLFFAQANRTKHFRHLEMRKMVG